MPYARFNGTVSEYVRQVDRFKATLLEQALTQHQGNRTQAARSLGLCRPNFCRMLKKYARRAA